MELLMDKSRRAFVTQDELRCVTETGADALVRMVAERTAEAVGGCMNAAAFEALSPQQVTLWAYAILRDEMMEGGCVQLIHNGWGNLFFRNPFARAVREWGMADLAAFMNKMRRLWQRYGDELALPCSDEEFMALYERFPAFDVLDDYFVLHEEKFTLDVARYVEEYLEDFVTVVE